MAVTYGKSGSTSSFNKKVGMGSIAHALVGDCMINCLTSSVLHGDRTDRTELCVFKDELLAKLLFCGPEGGIPPLKNSQFHN